MKEPSTLGFNSLFSKLEQTHLVVISNRSTRRSEQTPFSGLFRYLLAKPKTQKSNVSCRLYRETIKIAEKLLRQIASTDKGTQQKHKLKDICLNVQQGVYQDHKHRNI